MTETEQILETCIHEAAHFAFVVWAGRQVNRISIGADNTGEFVSGGHVEWEMVDDMSADSLAEIAAAGSAEDVVRGRYTFDEVFDSSAGDQEGFASLMRNGSNLDEFAIRMLFMKGIESASKKLGDAKT